jgi:hypothetical protein
MSKLEKLQEELFELRRVRAKITFEKGMAADDSKDLRENGVYIIMEEKEHYYTSKILAVTKEIETITRKPEKKKVKEKEEVKYEFKPHKWL